MRKLALILFMCFAFLLGSQGSSVYAQVVNSPTNDKNALDYRYQIYSGKLPKFADSITFRNRFYNIVSAGVEANWEESRSLKSYIIDYTGKFSFGYRLTPVHAIEADFLYTKADNQNSFGANLNYVLNINNFANRADRHNKFEALFIGGLSYRHHIGNRVGFNTGLRLQWNPGINAGFFIEPKVNVLADLNNPSVRTIPSLSFGFTLRYHKPNYYLWDYLTPIAIKTNLLYDAVTALNIGIEVPIRERWSIAFDWVAPWWGSTKNHKYFEMMYGNIEGRYWFGNREDKDQLTGWFAGASIGGGLYDFMFDNLDGKQGEFQAYSLVAGYAHKINKAGNLRLEYELGLGWLNSNFRKYWWDGYDYALIAPTPQSWNFDWFGPTKAQVSLVYILKLRSKVGGRE